MEIYAFVLVVLFGLIWAAMRASRGAGYTEAEKDNAENDAKILQKQRDNNVTTVADALRVFKRK